MKTINNFIQEKLVINKNIKSKALYDLPELVNVLGPWLFEKDTYKGVKNNRFEFLKYFNDNIMDLIDCFQGSAEKLANKLNLDVNKFTKIIKDNNDELYKKCKSFYLDIYDEIAF